MDVIGQLSGPFDGLVVKHKALLWNVDLCH